MEAAADVDAESGGDGPITIDVESGTNDDEHDEHADDEHDEHADGEHDEHADEHDEHADDHDDHADDD